MRLAGEFPEFERQATTWQAGQHQPDRLAALVVAHDVLVHSIGQSWDFAAPGDGGFGAVGDAGFGVVTSMAGWLDQRVG